MKINERLTDWWIGEQFDFNHVYFLRLEEFEKRERFLIDRWYVWFGCKGKAIKFNLTAAGEVRLVLLINLKKLREKWKEVQMCVYESKTVRWG